MFDVVLVADRGATAARIVRSCQALGASVVAVHSDADRAAAYVRHADEAVPLGGRGFDESYGDPRKLVEAARRSGADAVHPGAGRLGADRAVARAVEDAGLAWLGLPSAVLDRTDVLDLAAEVSLPPAVPSDRVQALLAVTVLPDRGAVRQAWVAPDVSPDRPVVESAPAPALDAGAQEHLLRSVRALTGALGVGPVACARALLDADGRLRFTGLTPAGGAGSMAAGAVLGVDLDEALLQLSGGGTLRSTAPAGSALCLAVRAATAFAGRLRRWRLPQVDGVLVDAGVAEGVHLRADTDRLLAVLTAVGADAGEAQARAHRALADLTVQGVPTTLPLLREVLGAQRRPPSSPLVQPVQPRSRTG